MRGILVVKYPRPITSLKNNVKEFEKEASKALQRKGIESWDTASKRGFWHSLCLQCIKKRKSVPPIEVSKVGIETDLGGAFHYFGIF